MCLLLFYVNPEAGPNEFFLVLASVRDEIYNRPTKEAHFWAAHPNVIGGTDMEPGKEGGTWLAMSKTGKIGVLLNILQPEEEILPNKKGRGFLAVDYVTGEVDGLKYLDNLYKDAENYNEFLLLTMDYISFKEPKMACFTNSSPLEPFALKPGIHAFGNSVTPDTPWPKVGIAKQKFSELVQKYSSIKDKEILVNNLFDILQDRTYYGCDETMLKQGKGKPKEYLKKLSAIFVYIPESNYGSRCHTVITVDGSGNTNYFERSRDEKLPVESRSDWIKHLFAFNLQSK